MMNLSSWPFLLLIVLLLVLYKTWKKRNKPASILYSHSIPKEIRKKNPVAFLLLFKLFGLALLILALARPQSSFTQVQRMVSGVDIMMVMDVSASMNVEDSYNFSRLQIAKKTMEDFVKDRPNDRIGFVVFSGEPLTLVPPTLDTGLLLNAIRTSETGILKNGTAIGDGLALAVGRLKDSKAKSKVVILLTDGDNNVGQIDPTTAGELASGFGIKVYAIAIGKEGKVRVPIKQQGPFGQIFTTYQIQENAMNPELLEQIAKETKGKFFRVTDLGTLDAVFKEIDKLEKSEVKSLERVRYKEAFQFPLKLGLLFLVIEQILTHIWWRFLL